MTIVEPEVRVIKVVRKDNKVTVSRKGAPGGVGPIGLTGERGPVGPPGPAGDTIAAISFQYTQNAPSNQWNITHNLGFRPNVSVVDSGGNEVEGEITYLDANEVRITFSSAFGGEAYLS